MLKRIDPRTVESSQGFEVTVPDIHTVVYSERGKSAQVEIEGGRPASGLLVWSIYASTLSPIGAASVSDFSVSRPEIISRVSAALSTLGMDNKIE